MGTSRSQSAQEEGFTNAFYVDPVSGAAETKPLAPTVHLPVLIASAAAFAALVAAPDIRKDPTPVPGQPYDRYFTHDRYGREITFYVTRPTDDQPKPLALFVHGSGATSNFTERNGRILPQNGQTSLYDAAKGAIRLVIVEKPGVKFLDSPAGGVTQATSRQFREEHTLERWSEAVSAALRAARGLPKVDRKRILVVGHSEGGLVAARVARTNRGVTHVAVLAGGGASQLASLLNLVRKGTFGAGIDPDPEKRVAYLQTEWRKVLADPNSTDKLFLGHPYRRWSSFLVTSPMEELAAYRGKVYIGQGTEDAAVDVESADVLYGQLLAKGRDVTYDRVPGVDHSFGSPTDRTGWVTQMGRILRWFLPPSP